MRGERGTEREERARKKGGGCSMLSFTRESLEMLGLQEGDTWRPLFNRLSLFLVLSSRRLPRSTSGAWAAVQSASFKELIERERRQRGRGRAGRGGLSSTPLLKATRVKVLASPFALSSISLCSHGPPVSTFSSPPKHTYSFNSQAR